MTHLFVTTLAGRDALRCANAAPMLAEPAAGVDVAVEVADMAVDSVPDMAVDSAPVDSVAVDFWEVTPVAADSWEETLVAAVVDVVVAVAVAAAVAARHRRYQKS